MQQLLQVHRQRAQVFPLQIHPFRRMLDLRCRGGKILGNICKEGTCTICFLGPINPSFRFHYLGFLCLLNVLLKSKLWCLLQELHCRKSWYRWIVWLICMLSDIVFWILSLVLQIFHLELEISISIPSRFQKAKQHYLNALNHFQKMASVFNSYIFSMKISN